MDGREYQWSENNIWKKFMWLAQHKANETEKGSINWASRQALAKNLVGNAYTMLLPLCRIHQTLAVFIFLYYFKILNKCQIIDIYLNKQTNNKKPNPWLILNSNARPEIKHCCLSLTMQLLKWARSLFYSMNHSFIYKLIPGTSSRVQ